MTALLLPPQRRAFENDPEPFEGALTNRVATVVALLADLVNTGRGIRHPEAGQA